MGNKVADLVGIKVVAIDVAPDKDGAIVLGALVGTELLGLKVGV